MTAGTFRATGWRQAACLTLLVALLTACSDPAWREINIPDGGFRMATPVDPRVEKNELDTPLGKITAYWYAAEGKDWVYGVGYSDYPLEILKRSGPRQLFTIVRDGWVKRIDGKVQGNGTEILLDNRFPGMEFIASGKLEGQDAYLRGRFYFVGNRLFQVIAFGKKSAMAQSDINRFLSSFKLSERLETSTVIIEGDTGKTRRERK